MAERYLVRDECGIVQHIGTKADCETFVRNATDFFGGAYTVAPR